jgi:hypothetical protein
MKPWFPSGFDSGLFVMFGVVVSVGGSAVVSGDAIPTSQYLGSPIVANNTITLFSVTCCSPGSVYTTTIADSVAALDDPVSYGP